LRIVVAPDSFKGSIDAATAAEAIAEGWRSVRGDDEIRMLPQADGGEGTLAAIASAVAGARFHDVAGVTGPDGRTVPGRWLELPDGTAVVELALSSGLPLMAEPDPLGATTRGLGETIAAALDAGATSLVIGLGGSASTDGGAGALSALGARLLDAGDHELADGGGELLRLARVDLGALRTARARLLTDVTAPLLGPAGAAAVFAPQKGAGAGDVRTLEAALTRFASVLGGSPEEPGAGAAGGTAYGFATAWGARIEPGAVEIAGLTGLVAAAASADLVITGEGRFDATSLSGKVVGHLLSLAPGRTAVIAGQFDVRPPGPGWSLSELAGSTAEALADPSRWLVEAAASAARVGL
jgi:glycerate kinase